MSTRRWFGRQAIELKSERIGLNVATPASLVRINGASEDQIAVANDLPITDVIKIEPTAALVVPTAGGTFLTFTSIDANTHGASLSAADTITITKKGVYTFHIYFNTSCGAEVPYEARLAIWVNGAALNAQSVYNNGGIGATSRTARWLFIHKQPVTSPSTIKFEYRGDSIPNGTAINFASGTIFLDLTVNGSTNQ